MILLPSGRIGAVRIITLPFRMLRPKGLERTMTPGSGLLRAGHHAAARAGTSDREHPHRDDGAERRKSGDGPAGGIGGFIVDRVVRRFGSHHCVAPLHGLPPGTTLPWMTTTLSLASSRTPLAPKAPNAWRAASRITDR